MIKHNLPLEYTLAEGWLQPFSSGILSGGAVARQCSSCTEVSFPPHRTCRCGDTRGSWITLDGRADIHYRTMGADGDFALVKFRGADTLCTVKLCNFAADQRVGQLRAATTGQSLPALHLYPVQEHT